MERASRDQQSKRQRVGAGDGRILRSRKTQLQQGTASDCFIHALPDEVLERVFSYLSTEDVAISVYSVCLRWKKIVETRSLKDELVFDGHTITTKRALRLIEAAPNLKVLLISNRGDVVPILQAASACKNLCRLVVDECYSTNKMSITNALLSVARSCPDIQDVTINETDLVGTRARLQQLGAALPNLRKLSFSNELDSPGKWNNISALLVGCDCLEELTTIFYNGIQGLLANFLRRWRHTLQVITLFSEELVDEVLKDLSMCTKLQDLYLQHANDITGEGLQFLANLTLLKNLHISKAEYVTTEEWCNFFLTAEWARSLRKLTLSDCDGLDDSVMQAIATTCHDLEELNLSFCSNLKGTKLNAILKACSNLRKLTLIHSGHTVLEILAERPLLASKLIILEVAPFKRSEMEQHYLQVIRSALPRLQLKLW